MKHLKFCQLAPMNIHFVQFPLEYFLDTVAALELERIELWGGGPEVCIDTLSFFRVQQIKKMVAQRKLKIACFTPETCFYPINLASPDQETRSRSLRYCLRGVDIAAELEAPLMQVVSGKGYFDEPNDQAWDRARESLSLLAERAQQCGVQLPLEPLSPYESNLVNSLQAAKTMLAQIGSPCLGINVDTVPVDLTHTPLQDYFDQLGAVINHFHFCDRTEQAGWVPCGDGQMPLKELLEIMDRNGYGGSLGLEICGVAYYKDPAAALQRAVGRLRMYMEG